MLLTSWVRNFRQSLKSRRRAVRREQNLQTQAWNGRANASRVVEMLEERTLLTALVIDQNFVNANSGVINITNATIDQNSDSVPEFDEIIINSVVLDGNLGRGININLSNLSIDRIGIQELSITGNSLGAGVNITLNNVNLNSLVIDRSNITSSNGGGIDIDLIDVQLPELTVYQTIVAGGLNEGLTIDVISVTRDASVDELDISESTIDGVTIVARGLTKTIIDADPTNPVRLTVVDYGLQPGTRVTVDDVVGINSANTATTVSPVLTVNPISGLLEADENVLTLDGVNGTGGFYVSGGTLTVYTTIGSARITENNITGATGNDGVQISFTNTRTTDVIIQDNPVLRSLIFDLTNSPVDGLTIRNNANIAADRPQVDGVRFNLNESSLTNLIIDNNIVTGNGASGAAGIVFDSIDSNVLGMITNNTVTNTISNGLEFNGVASSTFVTENRGPLVFDFALRTSATRLATGVNASTTSLTVIDGRQFQPQQFLLIENEQVFVQAVVGNTLTVVRGERGTLPAPHLAEVDVKSVTTAISGQKNGIVGNTFSANDGAGIFSSLTTNVALIADIESNRFLGNLSRAIDLAVQNTGSRPGQLNRGGVSRTATTLNLVDTKLFSNFLLPFNVMVEGEEMTVTAINGDQLSVIRGVNDTMPKFHDTNIDVIPVNGDGLILNIGGATRAQGNFLDQNVGGGIHLELQDNAVGKVNIRNNVITNTLDSSVVNNDGDAIEIESANVDSNVQAANILRRSVIDSNLIGVAAVTQLSLGISGVLQVFQVVDSSIFAVNDIVQVDGERVRINSIAGNVLSVTRGFSGTSAVAHSAGVLVTPLVGRNQGRGIDFNIVESSALEDLQVTNNVIANNDDDGIRFFRVDDGLTRTVNPAPGQTRAVTITGNTITSNAGVPRADVQIAAGTSIIYAGGIEVHVLNGTGDEFDVTIDSNRIYSTGFGVGALGAGGSVNGINLRTEADSRILGEITNNQVRFSRVDGLSTTERANAPSDLRDVSVNVYGNDFSDNGDDGIDISVRSGENQVMVIGQEGFDSMGRSLRNTLNRNFDSGIEVSSNNNFLAIINNDMDLNGTGGSQAYGTATVNTALTGNGLRVIGTGSQIAIKGNSIDSNAGAGIDIQNGGLFTIRDNSFTFNQNDGLELAGRVQATILNNFIASNRGRGLDILVEPGGAGESNYLIGNGQETGRNRFVGNNLEGLYYVITADTNQDQNLDSAAAMATNGSAVNEANAILHIDTNTITDNGVGTAGSATGLVLRIGSQGGTIGSLTLATTLSSGNEGDAWTRYRQNVDPLLPAVGPSTDANGYGTIGSEQENANGRTNARIVNNNFSGNFGDDVRFEAFDSTVDPQDTVATWTVGGLGFAPNGYQADPLSRLNLVFEANSGDGLQAFGIPNIATANTASYWNDEQVVKRRDGGSNAALTPTPGDGESVAPFGPWPTPVPPLPPTLQEAERVVYRIPSRTHVNNPLTPLTGDPTSIRSPFVPPRSLVPDLANVEPDGIFTVVNIQDIDIGNGIFDLMVTVAPNPFYPAGLPFPENGISDVDQGLFPVVEISGVIAVGGGFHTANGNFQVYDVDQVSHTFRLRGTGGHAGAAYLMGGQVVYNQNPPLNNPAGIDDPEHGGLPFDQAYPYPGSGEGTFRIAHGFDTVGLGASNEFRNGTNFTDTFTHQRGGSLLDDVGVLTNVYHFIQTNIPLISNPWGIWTENVGRSGGISNVQPDPTDPMNRTLITAPNHKLTQYRRVQTSDILGLPDANSTEFARVVDINSFSIPVPFIGVYGGGGSWETVDDSFPLPAAPTFPLSNVTDITPDPRTTNSGIVTLKFTENVDHVDIDDLFLTRDGVPIDISSFAVTQVNGSTYEVNLSTVTQEEGLYELIIDVTLPTADIVNVTPDPSLSPIGKVIINFTEDVTGVDIFDFTLTRDINNGKGAQSIDLSEIGANLEVEQITRKQYTIDLTTVTTQEGLYRLTLLAPQVIGLNLLNVNAQNEAVFNAVQHGLSTGQTVLVEGIVGTVVGLNTFLNGNHRIIVDDADNFRIADLLLANAVQVDDVFFELSQATLSIDSKIIDRVGRRFSLEIQNGVVQPANASDVFILAAQSPTGQIVDITPDPRNTSVNDVFFNFSEPVVVTSVGLSDFTLTRNIGFGPFPVSLAAGTVTALNADALGHASQFVLSNLGGATSAAGNYRLTLITTDSTRIQDRQGQFIVFPDFDDWTLTTSGPAPFIQPVFPDPTTSPVGLVRFSFNEAVTSVDLLDANAHFTLTRDAGDGLGPQRVLLLDATNVPITITQNSGTDFEFDLTPVTSDGLGNPIDGSYKLTLNRLSGIKAQGDSELMVVETFDTWLQDSTPPTADILDVDPDPRIRDAGLIFIEFDEPVTGIDRFSAATDFTLLRDIGDGNSFQNVTLVGQRVRPLNAKDVNGNPSIAFDPQTVFSTTYVLDLSATGLTDIDGTYILSLDANGSIVDSTGNQFAAPVSDTWILVPKGPISGIDDIVFLGNAVTVDSNDIWFNDTTVPVVVPGTVNIQPDPRSTSVGFVTINFSEDVTGFNLTDLVLSRNTGSGAQQIPLTGLILTQIDQSRYTIDLNLVTGGEGTYTLFIQGSNSLIKDMAGNPLQTGLITLDTWTVENIGPSASLILTPNPRTTPADNILLTFTKDVRVSDVNLSDLRLERDTGSGFSMVAITSGSVTANSPIGGFDDSFTINLSALTNVEGTYRITLRAADSGIVDSAGIELGADASTIWTLDNTAPLADIIDIFPDPRLSVVDIANILFNEGVTGVDIGDFRLTLNGSSVDISTAPFVEETPRRYTLDLSNFTATDGTYELRLLSTGNIADLGGNPLVDGAGIGIAGVAARDIWFKGVDNVAPTVDIVNVTTPRSTSAGIVQFNFSEDVTGVDAADLRLTFNSNNVNISGAVVTNLPGSASEYTIDLTDLTAAAGTYVLSVVATDLMTPVVDASGNLLLTGDSNMWVNQEIDPFASISPITPNPRMRPVGVVTVTFSVPVTGVDTDDFSLTRNTGTGAQPVSLRGVTVTPSPTTPLGTQYLIDLTKVTGGDGDYRFTLNSAGSGITSVATGDPLLSESFRTWTIATTISVNTLTDTRDTNPGDGVVSDSLGRVSLRAAVMEAGKLAGNDTILLSAGTYSLGINGDDEEFAASGDLDIFDTQGTLTIRGAGVGQTIINAAMLERVFHITNGGSLILDGVTLTGGLVEGSQDGAGIRNDAGTVVIRNSEIRGNVSRDDGGGINNAGTMTIINSTISGNTTSNNGGAIRNIGTLTISNSLIGGNVNATTMVDTRNKAGLNGGGVYNVAGATLTIDNTTISGNVATLGSGGGAFNLGTFNPVNVTIAANSAGQRGGGLSASGGIATLRNVLIVGNTSINVGPDVSVPGSIGAINTLGSTSNVIGNNGGATLNFPVGLPNANGDFVGSAAAPLNIVDFLETNSTGGLVLKNNGGPTLTHALVLPRPGNTNFAINRGALQTALLDQRGISRLLGNGTVDVGAYEFGGYFTDSTIDSVDVTPGDGIVADNFGRKTLRAAIMEVNALAAAGTSVINAIMLDNATYDLSLTELDTIAPTVDIVDVTPDPLANRLSGFDPIDQIVFQFSEPVLNVDLTDLSLTFNPGAGPVVLSLVGTTLTQDPNDATRYTLSGLRTLLQNDGLYRFNVNISNITDFEFNPLAEDPQLVGSGVGDRDEFTRGADVFAPTVVVSMIASNRTTNPGIIDINFSENIFGLSLSSGAPNFTLTYDNGSGPVPVSLNQVAVQQISFSQYQLDLTPVTDFNGLTDIGTYVLTLDAALLPIQDFSGNQLVGNTIRNWTVVDDTIAPIGTFDPVTPSPRIGSVGLVTLNFDEPVMGVDLLNAETDFNLTFDPDGPGIMPSVAVDLSGIMVVKVTDSQYTIDLSTVTLEDGVYTLTLVAADGLITDQAMNLAMTTNPLVANDSIRWVVGDDVVTSSTVVTTVVDLDFSQAVPGSIQDQAGLGTGFTTRLPGTGAGLPANDPNLQLQTANGRLLVRSTQADIPNGGLNLGQYEAPGIFLPGIGSQDFEVTSVFRNVQVPNQSDQLLIYVGSSASSLVRVGVHEGPSQPQIVVIENQGGADSALPGPGLPSNVLTAVNAGDDVRLTFGRINGSWELFFDNLTNPSLSGSTGPMSFPFLDAQVDLYVGIAAANARSATSFTGNIDSFSVAASSSVVSNPAAFGDLDLTAGSLTIIGVGDGNSLIDANQIDRVFDVFAGVTLNFTDVVVTGGSALNLRNGGGLRNIGTVNLTGTDFLNNTAGGNGGGIYNDGTLSVTGSRFIANTANFGGAIYSDSGSVVVVTEGTLANNTALTDGGGFYNDRQASVSFSGSIISGNAAADDGGGIYNNDTATATISDSTITNNFAGDDGGGLYSEQAAVSTLTNTNIAFNRAANGGGVFNQGGTVSVALSTFSANTATFDGGGFYVSTAGSLNANDSTLSGNVAGQTGGGFFNAGNVTLDDIRVVDNTALTGGGIGNTSNLIVTAGMVSGNLATGNGGGISNTVVGNLTLNSTRISNNESGGEGGAIYNANSSGFTLNSSTISGNKAADSGGAISQHGTGIVSIVTSTLSGNSAANGGGINSTKNLNVQDSTISGNSATVSGGAIFNNGGVVTLQSATIVNNSAAGSAGGIRNLNVFGPINLKNTIVARNTSPVDADIRGVQFVASGVTNPGSVALGFNLIGDRGSVTSLINGISGNLVGTTASKIDPLLGALQDNGGPSLTHAVLFGSPARDTGSNFGAKATDQRGFARIFDGDGNGVATVDIGSFESGFTVNTFTDSIDVNEGDRSSADAAGNSSLRAAIMEANALAGDDTILLIPGTYRLTIGGRDDNSSRLGDLDVRDSLTIIGAGTDQTFIDAAGLDRVFHVLPSGRLNLKNLTVIGGVEVKGGGILNQGFLTLENVIVQQNRADFGGGVFNDLLTGQLGATTLPAAIGAATSPITVANGGNLPVQTPFVIQVNAEQMEVTARNGNQLTVTRGFGGTMAVAHAINSPVNLLLSPVSTVISVNNAPQFPISVPFDIRVGMEEMRVVSINGNTYNVTRGVNGTTPAVQVGGATVTLVQELTITDSTITDNESRLQGGGLFNRNDSTALVRANISGNNSNAQGGGLFNRGSLTIVDSTFDANRASGTGGAIYNDGLGGAVSRITLTSSTLSNNRAGAQGGAIYNNNLLTIVNTTISGNHANAVAGAILNTQTSDGTALPGSITITNSTVTNNSTDSVGGGIVNSSSNALNRIDVVNSIIAGNNALMADNDVIGSFNSLGANLIGESNGTNGFTNNVRLDLVGTIASPFDPVIGDLANNGGATLTHTLLTGSPAIDTGNNSGGDPVDQRGGRRPTDTTADIGAFEIQLNHLSINNLTMAEGDTGSIIFTFSVVLENPTAEPISVNFRTVQDTAKQGSDFLPQSGMLNFAPGDVTQTIAIEVNGDISIEAIEQFFILLSNPVNAVLTSDMAVGTITNDDTALTIGDVNVREGDSGSSKTLTFTVRLSQPTVETVTVTYQTFDITASAGADYDSATGTLVFAPGELVKTFDVTVLGDNFLETNERFFANVISAIDSAGNNILIAKGSATGTINNDEVSVSVSFSDPNMDGVLDLNEGNTGTTQFNFNIVLDQPVDATVLIDVSTIDSTAIGGSDFVAKMQTLTFSPGETSQAFVVSVNGDTSFETDEQFFVRLANAKRDGVADPSAALGVDAVGRILNDEPLPDQYLIISNVGNTLVEVYRNDPTMLGAPIQVGDLVTQLVVNGDNGGLTSDDIFIVDYSRGNPIPVVAGSPGLVVNGLTQVAGDSLVIRNGSATNVTYTSENSTDGMIQIDSRLIEYNGLEPITDNLNAVNRTFQIHAGNHQIRLSDDTAISGNSIVDSNQTSAFESVSFANPTGSLTINAGSGNNTITMMPVDAAFSGSTTITVNGQSGNDTVNAQTFNRSFTLNGDAGNDVLNGGTAADTINGGLGMDTIDGGAGNDVIRGNDAINPDDDAADSLSGGAGADDIQGEGGNDVINGGSENDTLSGGAGNDVVNGGSGNDNIDGGVGNDALNGDEGNDVITGVAGMDTVTGGAGNDTVSGGDDNDNVNGGADNDVVSGGTGDDIVGGGTGNDNVQGDDGSDTLSGGGGIDTLNGGAGLGTDQVTETAMGAQNITLTNTTIIVGGLTTTHTNIDMFILIGGNLGNVIDSSSYSGSVVASGGEGNDTLIGGSGNDVLSGDDGNDVIAGNGGNDTVNGGGGNDSITGGAGNDVLSGNSSDDTLRGGTGDDLLSGDSGIDSIFGDDGDDTLRGGDGNDNLQGGADEDLILAGNGNDSADGGTGDDIIDGEDGNDVLLGGDGGDILIGNFGDDYLDGQEGPDTALGSAGVDTMVAGNGNDFMDGQGSLGDVILVTTTTLNDVLVVSQIGDFTRLQLTNQTPFTIDFRRTEQVRLNTLGGDDVFTTSNLPAASPVRFYIDFGAGNDSLNAASNTNADVTFSALGGAGLDTLISGAGNDELSGGADNDVIDSQAGLDTASGGDGDDVVIGGLDDDTINGDLGNDTLIGGSGTDVINGGDGNDYVRGNGGKDTIFGGDGNDTLFGDQSGDLINGGAGNDHIAGRDGNDTLLGGDGADLIIGEDGSDFIIGGKGNDIISGGRNNDSIIGDLGDDVLFGDDDNDFLFGSAGSDLIVGGDGNDSIKGQGSNRDIILLGRGNGDPGSSGDQVLLASDLHEINNAFKVDQLLIDLLNF